MTTTVTWTPGVGDTVSLVSRLLFSDDTPREGKVTETRDDERITAEFSNESYFIGGPPMVVTSAPEHFQLVRKALPSWALKPTVGDPEWGVQHDEPIPDSITWDIGFGFTLNVHHDDYEDATTPLTIGAHISDADLARGWVKREVTPDQLDKLAQMLQRIAAKQRQRETAKALHCEGPTEPEVDHFLTSACECKDDHRVHRYTAAAAVR